MGLVLRQMIGLAGHGGNDAAGDGGMTSQVMVSPPRLRL